jgi:hypothetical protein
MTARIKTILVGPEVAELIRVEIESQLPVVVHDVVAEMLQVEIKRQAKAIRKKGLGPLFDQIETKSEGDHMRQAVLEDKGF